MNRLAPLLPLALTLAACAPVPVRVGDARLTATARTPGGAFSFDCNPALVARQGGTTLMLGGSNSFACPSTDGRATLALTIFEVTSPPAPQPPAVPGRPTPPRVPDRTSETQAQVLLVVPGRTGGVPLTYSAQARLGPFEHVGNRRLRGAFTADLGGGVNVRGNFNLVGE